MQRTSEFAVILDIDLVYNFSLAAGGNATWIPISGGIKAFTLDGITLENLKNKPDEIQAEFGARGLTLAEIQSNASVSETLSWYVNASEVPTAIYNVMLRPETNTTVDTTNANIVETSSLADLRSVDNGYYLNIEQGVLFVKTPDRTSVYTDDFRFKMRLRFSDRQLPVDEQFLNSLPRIQSTGGLTREYSVGRFDFSLGVFFTPTLTLDNADGLLDAFITRSEDSTLINSNADITLCDLQTGETERIFSGIVNDYITTEDGLQLTLIDKRRLFQTEITVNNEGGERIILGPRVITGDFQLVVENEVEVEVMDEIQYERGTNQPIIENNMIQTRTVMRTQQDIYVYICNTSRELGNLSISGIEYNGNVIGTTPDNPLQVNQFQDRLEQGYLRLYKDERFAGNADFGAGSDEIETDLLTISFTMGGALCAFDRFEYILNTFLPNKEVRNAGIQWNFEESFFNVDPLVSIRIDDNIGIDEVLNQLLLTMQASVFEDNDGRLIIRGLSPRRPARLFIPFSDILENSLPTLNKEQNQIISGITFKFAEGSQLNAGDVARTKQLNYRDNITSLDTYHVHTEDAQAWFNLVNNAVNARASVTILLPYHYRDSVKLEDNVIIELFRSCEDEYLGTRKCRVEGVEVDHEEYTVAVDLRVYDNAIVQSIIQGSLDATDTIEPVSLKATDDELLTARRIVPPNLNDLPPHYTPVDTRYKQLISITANLYEDTNSVKQVVDSLTLDPDTANVVCAPGAAPDSEIGAPLQPVPLGTGCEF